MPEAKPATTGSNSYRVVIRSYNQLKVFVDETVQSDSIETVKQLAENVKPGALKNANTGGGVVVKIYEAIGVTEPSTYTNWELVATDNIPVTANSGSKKKAKGE